MLAGLIVNKRRTSTATREAATFTVHAMLLTKPSNLAQAVTFLTWIREVSRSNLDQDIGYSSVSQPPDCGPVPRPCLIEQRIYRAAFWQRWRTNGLQDWGFWGLLHSFQGLPPTWPILLPSPCFQFISIRRRTVWAIGSAVTWTANKETCTKQIS
jgi:hypothetical protein